MAFFKTLTLFIVCISIFRIIISKTKIVRKRRNQEYQKNCLFGYLNCNGCGTDEVLIIILENGDYSTTSTATCDSDFYVYTNTTPLGERKTFTGNFHDMCVPEWKNITDRKATFVSELYSTFYYTFGIITFNYTQRKKRSRVCNKCNNSVSLKKT